MKLCFSTLGCPEWGMDEIIKSAMKFDMQGVELRGFQRQHISPGFSPKERSAVREMFRSNGLEIACICAYTRFSGSSGEERAKNENELLRYAELAEDVGCKFVRTFIGEFPALPQEEVYRYITESLNHVTDKLQNSEVKILVENHDQLCTSALLQPLFDQCSDRIGFLWDVEHSFSGSEAPQKTMETLGSRICHVHLRDLFISEGKVTHCMPGLGIIPLGQCVKLLTDSGYEGFFSLEWEKTWIPELPALDKVLPVYSRMMRRLLA